MYEGTGAGTVLFTLEKNTAKQQWTLTSTTFSKGELILMFFFTTKQIVPGFSNALIRFASSLVYLTKMCRS
jgi:hypothetical protein